MSEPEKKRCACSVVKVKRIGLTRFEARCSVCHWSGPATGRDKAAVAASIHESGGQIIGWDVPSPVRKVPITEDGEVLASELSIPLRRDH